MNQAGFKGPLTLNTKCVLNNGLEMPVFGLGLYKADSGEETISAILYALKTVGYRLLDSAQFYENEKDVGEAIRQSGISRDDIFVTTKLFTTEGGREKAIQAVEQSLAHLNIGYIDQILIHAPQGGHVLECYDVLVEYQQRGLIKSVGVSNFGIKHLEALKNSGRPLPQVNQIELHPWCLQEEICAWCRENSVQVVGYSPMAQNRKSNDPVLLELAQKYAKTPAQILIRYSLQKDWITIPKSTKPQRLDENANVFDFSLSLADMETLDEQGWGQKENVCWDPTENDLKTHFGPLK